MTTQTSPIRRVVVLSDGRTIYGERCIPADCYARHEDHWIERLADGEWTKVPAVEAPACECSDPGCPVHRDASECAYVGALTLYRVDMEDLTGTLFCDGCAEDAEAAEVFTRR